MKKYEDKRVSFSYPDEFKLARAKPKWGQYNLQKKGEILIIIELMSDESVDSVRRLIRSRLPDDICDFARIEYFEPATIGEKQGIGHAATLYDHSHKFYQKLYRYLFPTSTGSLYIEVTGEKEFTIEPYRGILESIKVKEEG